MSHDNDNDDHTDCKQCAFGDALHDGIIDWLDQYKVDTGDMPRSDWIIYTLMAVAGEMLKYAPSREMKHQVLHEALLAFGEAAGGDMITVDRQEPAVN